MSRVTYNKSVAETATLTSASSVIKKIPSVVNEKALAVDANASYIPKSVSVAEVASAVDVSTAPDIVINQVVFEALDLIDIVSYTATISVMVNEYLLPGDIVKPLNPPKAPTVEYQTIQTYLSRVTNYVSHEQNFMEKLEVTLQPLVDAQNFLANLPLAFDIDYAVGKQLDSVGQWINLSRQIRIPIKDPWFRFGEIARGFGRGQWRQPFAQGNYFSALDDEPYRRLLKSRVEANKWDGTAQQALSIFQAYFFEFSWLIMADDKQTMDTVFAVTHKIPTPIDLEILSGNYLPLAASGVNTKFLITSVNDYPIFGFGIDNGYIGGFGRGAYGVTPAYAIDNIL